MRIATPRLLLRELVEDDWRAIHAIESDVAVSRYLNKHDRTEDEAHEYVQTIVFAAHAVPRMVFELAVTLPATGELIGRCGMRRSAGEAREAMLWYVIAPAHQRQGYASEAAWAVLGLAFDQLELHRVYADCDPRNPSSVRVMEKLGLRREGHFVENVWFKGEWCDSLIYAMLRREWAASPKLRA